MMLLTVNGREKTLPTQPAETLGALVARLAVDLAAGQVLATGVQVDGSDYAPARHAGLLTAAVQHLEVTTAPFANVSARLVEGTAALVETLAGACAHAAQELSVGRTEQSWQLVLDCIEGLEALAQAATQLQIVHPALAAGWARVEATLPSMVAALDHQDWVGLADSLQFEVGPALANWQERLIGSGSAQEA